MNKGWGHIDSTGVFSNTITLFKHFTQYIILGKVGGIVSAIGVKNRSVSKYGDIHV